jgi:hypothetical protein
MSLPRWCRKLTRMHVCNAHPSDEFTDTGTFPDGSVLVLRWHLQPVFVP